MHDPTILSDKLNHVSDGGNHRLVFHRSGFGLAFQIVVVAVLLLMLPLCILIGVAFIRTAAEEQNFYGYLFSLGAFSVSAMIIWVTIGAIHSIRARKLPLLVLDESGLHHFAGPSATLFAWADIESARIATRQRATFLFLGLSNPELYLDRFSRAFSNEAAINLLQLRGPERALLQAIVTHPRYRGNE